MAFRVLALVVEPTLPQPQPQSVRLVFDLPTLEGWKAELT